jgi:hypothetical protein
MNKLFNVQTNNKQEQSLLDDCSNHTIFRISYRITF